MPLVLKVTPAQAVTAAAALRNRAAVVTALSGRTNTRRQLTAQERSVQLGELYAIEHVAAELELAARASTGLAPR